MELEVAAHHFGDEIRELLQATLPGTHAVEVVELESGFVVRSSPGVRLTVKERHLANLRVSFSCCWDSTGKYLAVAKSALVLSSALDRTPLVRLEYDRRMYRAPAAHWQISAERGAFSHLLAHAGTKAPHDLGSLHFPVGGARYRPSLEDFLQFLIQECGIDRRSGWEDAVNAGRERWRLRQVAALVRDAPEVAARVLTELDYQVVAPSEGHREPDLKALHRW